MLSFNLQCALERELIGQRRAVHSVVRSITIALSGLGNPEKPAGIYLLMGPSGTGKTHLARTLARHLHGTAARLAVADCAQLGGRHDWITLTRQIAPHFRVPVPGHGADVLAMEPLSLLLIERLERARPEMAQALFAALETGQLLLPDGKCGSLRGCLILMTSNVCGREIYEAGRQEIGFVRASEDLEESEKARIYQLCASAAEKLWGADLLGHLDDLIVFHRLTEQHLPFILRWLVWRLNERLAVHGVTCGLDAGAADLLVARGARFLRHGAWAMVKVFRRFVVFPVADLVQGGGVASGSVVRVAHEGPDRLRFRVLPGQQLGADPLRGGDQEIPVAWDEPSSRRLHSALAAARPSNGR